MYPSRAILGRYTGEAFRRAPLPESAERHIPHSESMQTGKKPREMMCVKALRAMRINQKYRGGKSRTYRLIKKQTDDPQSMGTLRACIRTALEYGTYRMMIVKKLRDVTGFRKRMLDFIQRLSFCRAISVGRGNRFCHANVFDS